MPKRKFKISDAFKKIKSGAKSAFRGVEKLEERLDDYDIKVKAKQMRRLKRGTQVDEARFRRVKSAAKLSSLKAKNRARRERRREKRYSKRFI